MKSIVLPLLIATSILAGCGPKSAHPLTQGGPDDHGTSKDGEVSEAAPSIQYKAALGLSVPPEVAEFLGVKTGEVAARTVRGTRQFAAQVYRDNEGVRPVSGHGIAPRVLASGRVDTQGLKTGLSVAVETRDKTILTGRLAAVRPVLEGGRDRAEVLIDVADPDQRLAQGDFISVQLPTGQEETVSSVPRSALLTTLEGTFVYTLSGDHYARTAVKLGASNDDFAEITEGLYAGDIVVTHPVMTLWLAELQSVRGGTSCAHGH